MKAMKNINNEWMLVVFFGVIISLLIGVSYNASNATLSLGEREKIPLYYASTRDLLNITYGNKFAGGDPDAREGGRKVSAQNL
ncbi:MAG: hypothetical protein ACRD8Z_09260 [Nitrososphaeraceae archaeon]